MKIRFLVAWYDLWVGAFWDTKKRLLYILPIPCVGLVIEFTEEPAIKRQLTLAVAFALLIAAAVMQGPDGGTGRHQTEEKR